MQKKHDLVFHKVISKAQKLGLFDLLGVYQECNTKLVAQFCATAWWSGNGYEQTLNFSIKGHLFNLHLTELPTIFGSADNDFHRPEIITKRTIADNELAQLYILGNESNYGKTHGLIPEYTIFINIFRNILTPKRGDHTNIWGSTRNLLLAILDDKPPPCISNFFWTEMMNILTHGVQYVIYAPYIQRIINYKIELEFGYDGKHEAYQPHIVKTPVVPPPSPPAAAHGSPPAGARASPASGHAPSAAPKSSRADTRRGKKQNILVKGLKTLISMCRSNDALIHESHQQMS
jgi:hypothetical protein